MLPFYGSASVAFVPNASCRSAAQQGGARGTELGGGGGAGQGKDASSGHGLPSGHSAEGEGSAGLPGRHGGGLSSGVDGAAAQRTHRRASPRERQVIEAIVGTYTQRLQVQERITHQVADAVAAELQAAAVVVVVDATHMCMVARGVENHAGATTTMACRGLASSNAGLCRQALLAARQQRQSRHKK